MPTAVKLPRHGGAMREVVEFLHRKRVHVGAQADGAPAIAASQGPDHAGSGEALMHLDAPVAQLLCDHRRGAAFLERGLGMRVEVAPPGRHVVM